MKKREDSFYHVRGESQFIDDMREPEGLLHAVVLGSPIACGELININVSRALQVEGVRDIITYKDIPGENQLGTIVQDNPLLIENEISAAGQPIAVIVADSQLQGRKASALIDIEYRSFKPVVDPRQAFEQGRIVAPPRTFLLGDTDSVWSNCDLIVEGRADTSGQEHLYLETQIAMVFPGERENFKVYSSTQNPTSVQKCVSRILDLSMHSIEVEVLRLGGAFGGKEEQANTWASLAALAAWKTGKPVKLLLPRSDDISMTGKRHPYSSDFKLGLKKDGTILAYEVDFYQNSGYCADLSTSVLERTLYHCTNSYYIPNVKATATPCYTNLNSFTAFRGFGGPQGMFVIEAAINRAAIELGIPPVVIQERNLLKNGDEFPYGMKASECRIRDTFDRAKVMADYDKRSKEIELYNSSNSNYRKALYIMPVTFGISFTTLFLNQAGALVHLYNDGSINVSTGVVEMGQGVNMKIARIVAETFSVSMDRVRIESTNTSRVANTSPTAASAGCDMNGRAAQLASREILDRLIKAASGFLEADKSDIVTLKDEIVWLNGTETDLRWEELVTRCYLSRTNLSSQAFYAVPDLYFDKTTEKGKPFAYHAYGSAVIEVTIDMVRGIYNIDTINICHDVGKSINEKVDRGQIEGGTIQGIGWLTTEDLKYSSDGILLSKALSSYKIPDINFTPEVFNIELLTDVDNPHAVLKSKAVGEPPFMYGIGAYFALINALQSAVPGKNITYSSPITPEKILMELYNIDKIVNKL